jgi:ribosomal protein S27AE
MRERYRLFMEAYNKAHEVCPKCGSINWGSTLVGYVPDLDHLENYKDKNRVNCNYCGWIGIVHDLVERSDFERE